MAERQMILVASKTKEYIKSKQCIVSSDALEELNNKVHDLIDAAVKRTKDNKRSTLRAYDF